MSIADFTDAAYSTHLVGVGCLQEHYCVTVGMNDATGAFSQFGLRNNAFQPRRDVPYAD